MLRISGILIGSALAVALLIVVLGMPKFGTTEPEQVEWMETPIASPDETPARTEPPVEPDDPAPVADADSQPDEEARAEDVSGVAEIPDEALVEAIFTPADERPVEVMQENWYAFWSPFRSEIAANGFIEQLQRTTGIDYRVVKQKPGVYEVAFAYDDEVDIQSKLDTISAATGLEMPGG